MVPVALIVWITAGLSIHPMTEAKTAANPLALQRSAYGSLFARLMKDSLHSYWHDGKQEHAGEHHDHEETKDKPEPPPPPGRLKLVRRPPPPPVETAPQDTSLLASITRKLDQLEEQRTERNSPFATSTAHRRFLTATADNQLYQAWQFDPCDAALYEIAHYTALSRAPTPELKRVAAGQLARRTVEHALAPTSGMSESLTGAGAVLNLFNDQLQPDRPTPPLDADLQFLWSTLNQCLDRYQTLRQQAVAEGWYTGIPAIRRGELEEYAAMMQKLAGMVREQLTKRGLIR